MKEGRLHLLLYMYGVQNTGTAGKLIDIVKESTKMKRKDCLTRLYICAVTAEITKSDTITKYLDLNDSKSTHHYGLKMSMTFL